MHDPLPSMKPGTVSVITSESDSGHRSHAGFHHSDAPAVFRLSVVFLAALKPFNAPADALGWAQEGCDQRTGKRQFDYAASAKKTKIRTNPPEPLLSNIPLRPRTMGN